MPTLPDTCSEEFDDADILGETTIAGLPSALPCPAVNGKMASREEIGCRALLLTQTEAFTLVALCLTSSSACGDAEESLLTKLGDYLRGFS